MLTPPFMELVAHDILYFLSPGLWLVQNLMFVFLLLGFFLCFLSSSAYPPYNPQVVSYLLFLSIIQ